jgi:hypothetical protein
MFPPRSESAGALYVKTDISPEQIFQAIGRLRKEARDEIDRLIRFLDATDNHMELEDQCEDEGAQCEGGGGEEGCEDEGADTSDREPSLGSCEASMGGRGDQSRWAAGGRRDLEDDPTESGIADHDGLLEQIGWQDWQHTVMA